ncbi:Rab-GAP/TBC domain protein [Drechmeria coniospora]|uniref:Rab-GAP/TBC domain protein n=1 Tax=Drechmeria coniospora TaxID=98403 RepID=A0A151GRG4_DRECN|nr:Rab-GAP/TBC domain protein [Drechmeria coniospora]KYK59707.1 Rab-GAP/TBC domain protein [Drechmeria coniospora]ODA78515.1 hypothetical protein RJ55_05896 [Drechmeria coniospora]
MPPSRNSDAHGRRHGRRRRSSLAAGSAPDRGDDQHHKHSHDDCDTCWSIHKRSEIIEACQWRDIAKLAAHAESRGGFLSDDLRRVAWPILLGSSSGDGAGSDQIGHAVGSPALATGDWKDLPRHRDEDQVELDVKRSFIYYPNVRSDTQLERYKSELSSLILEVLRRSPYLCYFQGYHDICQVFMLVLEPAQRARLVSRLSILRIRDFMLPNLGPTTAQLELLPDILLRADPELRRHVASTEPFYALAGTLTMYAHNIEAYRDISRLFDVLLAREPVFSLYLFAQIVIDRRAEILAIDEPDMLQVFLAKIPSNMDLDALIGRSVSLCETYPPDSLPSWKRVSTASVLKTATNVSLCAEQRFEDGHAYFQQQAKEIRQLEMRNWARMTLRRYRRPARAIGFAVLVAAIAYVLRRNQSILYHHITLLFSR